MAIEITRLPTSQLQNAADGPSATRTGRHNEQQRNTAQQETDAVAVVDTVSFTETATQLQAIERQIADLPIVDDGRIAMLQNLIERGEFEIDPNQIADRLIIFEGQI